jgi:hypothetical protein
MNQLKRWDTGTVIYEGEGTVAELLAATQKLGISKFRADLSRADLSGANLSGADLSRADLSGAKLSRADLSGANLSRADLSGAKLSRADLSRADLIGAKLSRADLSGANLIEANLSWTNLSWTNLIEANLSGAKLSGAKLPIWCRWIVSFRLDPLVVSIGCETRSINEWDAWFSGSEEFDTPRSDERFVRIRANYLAMRAYLVALGHHKDPT